MPTVIASILHIVACRNVFFFFFLFLFPEARAECGFYEAVHRERSHYSAELPHRIISNLFILNFGFCSLLLDTFICSQMSFYIAEPRKLQQFSIQCF